MPKLCSRSYWLRCWTVNPVIEFESQLHPNTDMLEMADKAVLETAAARHAGSTPVIRTKQLISLTG